MNATGIATTSADRSPAEEAQPGLDRHDGSDVAGMVSLYEQMDLLQPYMLPGLRPIPAAVADGWQKLHAGLPSVGFTLVSSRPGGSLQGAVSAVRAWDRAWLVQQFGVVPTAEPGAAAALQLAILEMVMPRADADHICFFVKADNARMNSSLDRFFSLRGTSEVASRLNLGRWALPDSALPGPPSHSRSRLELVRGIRERFASRVATSVLGSLAAGALSMVPGALTLRRTSRSFRQLGLERRRAVFALVNRGRTAAILLEEQASPGVSLPGMLDTWWILPADANSDMDPPMIACAADEIARRPGSRKLLLLPRNAPDEPLCAAGYTKLVDAYLYTLNRAGVCRYHEELTNRYGALLAAMKLRQARAARRAR
jgi:hypothetical protein